jgi:hypothetical protein
MRGNRRMKTRIPSPKMPYWRETCIAVARIAYSETTVALDDAKSAAEITGVSLADIEAIDDERRNALLVPLLQYYELKHPGIRRKWLGQAYDEVQASLTPEQAEAHRVQLAAMGLIP